MKIEMAKSLCGHDKDEIYENFLRIMHYFLPLADIAEDEELQDALATANGRRALYLNVDKDVGDTDGAGGAGDAEDIKDTEDTDYE